MVQADRAKDEVGDGLVSELRAAELRLRKEAMRRLCPFIQGVAHRPFAVLPQCSQSILSAVLPAYQMPHTVAGLDLSTHKIGTLHAWQPGLRLGVHWIYRDLSVESMNLWEILWHSAVRLIEIVGLGKHL